MTIEFELSEKSIDNAIHRINLYTEDFKKKAEILADRLAEDVKTNAENQLINHVDTGETFDSLQIEKTGLYTRRVLVSGAAVWLEFGTGVVANHATPGEYLHPKALELGMSGLGTYGKGNGSSLWGWWYYDEHHKKHHTYGIPATMFMYYSAWTTSTKVAEMARGLFHT